MPLFTGDEFDRGARRPRPSGSRQVLFPIVVLLGLNGLVVGILNAHEHFTIPALAPLVWNLVIIGALVGLTPLFEGDDQLYAYAIGVLAGTAVQLVMCLPPLRRIGFPLRISFDFRHDPRVAPGARADAAGQPRARPDQREPAAQLDDRLPRLRGGADARSTPRSASTCSRRGCSPSRSRPCCSRRSAGSPRRRDLAGLRALIGTGMRQISLLLIPSAAAFVALATPIVRLVYERGEFDAESTAQVERGAVLVLVLAAVLRHQPAAHAHVLLAPAAVAADAARALRRSSSTSSSRSRSTSRWGSAASCSARPSPTSC